MRELIVPNLHAAFIHIPIGLLLVGTLIELFAFCWRRSAFREAGRWMILIGALSMIPAATTGLHAARDVMAGDEYATWHDLKSSAPLAAPAWTLLERHLLLNIAGALLAAVAALSWVASSDRARRRFHFIFLSLLLAGVGLTLAGAYAGGEMVYAHGVAVSTDPPTSVPADASTIEKIDVAIDPMQWHLLGAGMTIALSLASLALATRAITVRSIVDENLDSTDPTRREVRSAFGSAKEFADALAPFVPSGRFWLLTTLAALLTAAGGVYVLGSSAETFQPQALWDLIKDREVPRRLAHAALAGAIILLPLILASVARWAPRSKLLLILLSTLLILLLAAQVWFGLAMLFDSPDGPILRTNPATASDI